MGTSPKDFKKLKKNLEHKPKPTQRTSKSILKKYCERCGEEITGATITSLFVEGDYCGPKCIEIEITKGKNCE